MPTRTVLPVLTPRELNRALLARQLLLERQRVGVVDGFVAATWGLETNGERAVVRVDALRRLTRTEKAAVASEGERLAAFLAPAARRHGVRV